jgi:protein-S-isoprenylcysteine O-methyltransferase Ste14
MLSEPITHYILLGISWIAWCALHSGLISIAVTTRLKAGLGSGFRFYRMIYNIISLLTLIPIVLYVRAVGGPILFQWSGPLVFIQIILLVLAVMLFIAGGRHYDLQQLLGIRQVRTHSFHGALTESGELDNRGVLSITRHPWYLGMLLLIWSAFRSFDAAILITNSVLTCYLYVGTLLEEQKLVQEYGDSYRQYQQQVSMLIPTRFHRIRRAS